MFIRSVFGTADTAGSVPVSNTIAVGSGNGSSLSPKAAFYEITGTTSLNGGIAHRRYGIGITDGTTQRCVGIMSENGQIGLATDSGTRSDNASVINFPLTTSEAIDGEASWDSWVNGGSKILVNNLFAAANQIRATYFFGDDIQCAVAELNVGISSNESVTGLSFAPNFAIAISYGSSGAAFSNDKAQGDLAYSHGYAVKTPSGDTQQVCFADFFKDRLATTRGGTILLDTAIAQVIYDVGGIETLGARLRVSSWNSDGITLSEMNGGTPATVALLLIGFTNKRKLYAGITEIPSDAVAGDFPVTGVGFTPEAYFTLATTCSAKNSLRSSPVGEVARGSSGSFTGVESGYSSGTADDGVSTGASRSAAGNNAVFRVVDSAGSDALAGTHVSLDSDGLTVNISGNQLGDNSPQVAFICIGPPQIIESETETIADQSVLIAALDAISETETIVDQHAIDVGMALSEDETIVDEHAMAVDMAQSETVEINENVILIAISNDALLLVLVDGEGILDQVVLDATGSLIISDTVEILDQVGLAGDALIVTSDTETITEDEQEYLGNLLVISDTETITDELSTPITVTQTKGTNRGTTIQGGPEEGETFQGGAERGTVM